MFFWIYRTLLGIAFIGGLGIRASSLRAAAKSEVFTFAANGSAVPVVSFSRQYDYAVATVPAAECRLQITRLDGKPIQRFSISPLRLGITGQLHGSTLSFSTARPEYLIVEIDQLPKLVIACDPPETDAPAIRGLHIYNVADAPYSADVTGQHDSTASIQHAIDDAAADQSRLATVVVPDGLFIATHLTLKTNVSLYLMANAVLKCDGQRAAFPTLFHKDSIKCDGTWFISTEDSANNVRIFGRGTIDGSGKHLLQTQHLLNHLLMVMHCSHFVMDGPVLRDSGLWGTVIARSTDVTVRNTKHFNFLDMGEDDCIDVCESQDAAIDRTIAVSLDDSYSVKSWTAGTDLARHWTGNVSPVRNVTFNHCLAWSRCFGFKVGAGVNQSEQGIAFKNSIVFDAAHGIGISDSYGHADLHDVLFDSIDIERCTCDCLGRSWARFVIDHRAAAGSIDNVRVRNITVRDAGTMPVLLSGMDDQHMIQSIHFENVHMPGASGSATTLGELKISQTPFARDITVARLASTIER